MLLLLQGKKEGTTTAAAEETASVGGGKRTNAAAVEAVAAAVMTPNVVADAGSTGNGDWCLSVPASHLLRKALTFRASAGRVAAACRRGWPLLLMLMWDSRRSTV